MGLDTPIDPIDYISKRGPTPNQSSAVKQFLTRIAETTQELETSHLDTGRLLTVFKVKLESTKKIGNADVIAGIAANADGTAGPLMITKAVDPNVSHPLKTKELVDAVGTLHGKKFTTHSFQAVAWKFGIKSKANFCWKSSQGELVKYSHDAIAFVKRLTLGDIELATVEYNARSKKKAVVPATATLPLNLQENQVAS